MNKDLARQLIEAGVHFGHGASRWHPKMAPYIFAKRGMIHIINVKETLKGLLIAKKLLTMVVSSGKDVVFVGTKRQAKKAVTDAAKQTGMHFIANRWLGGTLTNFRTIRQRVLRMEQLEKMEQDGSIESESKKMGAMLKRELNKIKSNLDGLRGLNKLPGAVVVVDVMKEKNALSEAKKLKIPTIGIIDTNSNPDMVDVAIPGNDDSTKAVDIILHELASAVAEGKTLARIQAASEDEGKTKTRSKRKPRKPQDKPASAFNKGEKKKTEQGSSETKASEGQGETEKAAEQKADSKPEEAKAEQAQEAKPEAKPSSDEEKKAEKPETPGKEQEAKSADNTPAENQA
ncbi:30S ribosomal protein S2 [Sedimentisphaera salicampi]|uniref:Small ribosomal subunit protein uS2 n=1 Tax=Sedimentisphaera salicampi TaxID=1941349 RepID=A0A1W6LKK8_9BACT|nr:30S ribosomal protein S2 [Sedimentisphaera salicampi]ARN56311.1 30S ribosomal protein S2 [Sedimentisphaera salicampi]OXU15593.1 30S ribosomal protein S2 [Sedimentisphaera salicampi]